MWKVVRMGATGLEIQARVTPGGSIPLPSVRGEWSRWLSVKQPSKNVWVGRREVQFLHSPCKGKEMIRRTNIGDVADTSSVRSGYSSSKGCRPMVGHMALDHGIEVRSLSSLYNKE